MTSPFRSELASLGERLRRAEEANAVLGEELAQLEKELALRGELHGPTRARVRAVVWVAAALLVVGLGAFAGTVAFEHRDDGVRYVMPPPAVRELGQAKAGRVACEQSLDLLAYNQGLCERSQPSR
jgi:hypothetical protein